MAFKLTNDQMVELQNSRNLFPDPVVGNSLDYALLYDLVLGYVAEYQQTSILNTEEAETVLWLEGARTVNRDIGEQSEFIRTYNDMQSQLRYGIGVTDAQMDQVSDEIVLAVIDEILTGGGSENPIFGPGELPPIGVIAQNDAGPAAVRLFQAEDKPAGWAGNPLFLFLNHGDAWNNNILHKDQLGNTDTYDLLSVVKITREIGFENIEDVGELITASFDVADQVNAGIVLGNAIYASEVYLNNAYGDHEFFFYSLLSISFTNIILGSNDDDVDNNALITTKSNDVVHGGTGNDEILGSVGSDILDGGTGTDTIDYRTASKPIVVSISDITPPSSENFIGTVQERSATPQWQDDLFNVEKIIGTNGRDLFSVSSMKNLTLDGDAGDQDKLLFMDNVDIPTIDVINGIANQINFKNFEEFSGNNQDNLFIDAVGEQKYDGKENSDTISYVEQDALQLSNGLSAIRIEANLEKGVIERSLVNGGEIETDTVIGIEKVVGASGDDVFKGKEGLIGQGFTGNGETTERGDIIDFSDYAVLNNGVSITLGGVGVDSEGGTYTTLQGIEQVIGTVSLDILTGDDNANWLFGNSGVDVLRGQAGDDYIIGGNGSDFLYGGDGDDTYYFSLTPQQTLWYHAGFDIISDESGTNDEVYLLGGYYFNPNDFTLSGTQVYIDDVARTENLADLEWVEYSDGAKFSIERLILDEADATAGTINNGNSLDGDALSNTLTASGNIVQVNGNDGDDWLYGTSSSTLTLNGGSGSDYLFGARYNTLDGGVGNDYLDGGLNSDIIYEASSGIDVILDMGSNGNLNVSGFTLWRADNGSLVVDHSGAQTADEVIASTNKIIIINHFNGSPLETINGIDVSTMSFKQLGTSIDDFLVGGNEDDNFSSSKGNDVQDGGTGTNTFNFFVDDTGSTLVKTTPDAEIDTLAFNGLLQNEVGVIRDASIGLNNLLFSYGQSYAILEDAVLDTAHANHINVTFSGDSPLTFASLDLTTRGSNENDIIEGDVPGFSTNDIIFGRAGDDVIESGDGEDTIYAGVGNDIVETGIGSDAVYDEAGDDLYKLGNGDHIYLGTGSDRIEYSGEAASSGDSLETFVVHLPSFISSNNIILSRDSDEPSFINLEYGGSDIDIQSAFTPILKFDSVTQYNINEFTLTTNGTDSDDSIIDFLYLDQNRSQDDIIFGHGGDDNIIVLYGGVDIVYGGSGNDVIGQSDPGYSTMGTVSFYGDDGNDVLSTLTLSGSLYGGDGDDTLISADITTNTMDGGSGNDWISAGNGGTDNIQGGNGDDIILGLLGGMKTVDGGLGNDLIILDSDGDDIIDGGDGLDIISFESAFGFSIAQINLSSQSANIDGVLYSYSNIEGAIGSYGSDTIIGNSANNILDGGTGFSGFLAGNDILEGGGGNDTYIFGTPFAVRVPPNQQASGNLPDPVVGDDTVDDSSGGADSIEFTDFFTLSDLSFNQVGNNLIISFTDGSVTITDHFGSGEIENLVLADGTVLDLNEYKNWNIGTNNADTLSGISAGEILYGLDNDDIINAYSGGSSLHGGFGADTLNGDIGNDILNGGAGDDIVSGGAGDDIYIFSPGDGFDVITETSGFDILSIRDAITLSDLTFTQVGDDLQIDIASGVTITDFYAGNSDLLIEEIHFDDGSTFDLTSLLNTPPIATDDSFSGNQDSIISGNVLVDNGNGIDNDADGHILSVTEETFVTANGVVSVSSNGDFDYFPSLGFSGQDSFAYTLEDGHGGSNTATVTIDIVATEPEILPIINSVAAAENLVDPSATLNGLDEITIVVQVTASQIGTDKGIFDTEASDGKDDALTMRYDASGWNGGGHNVIKLGLQTTAGQMEYESASYVQTTDTQHLVMTWKSGEALKLYIDGVEDIATDNTGALGGVIDNVQDLILGLGAKNAGGWAGSIDNFQVYDVAMDATAVNDLYLNADANRTPDAFDDEFVGAQDAVLLGNVMDNNGSGADSDPDADILHVIAGTYSTLHGSLVLAGDGAFTYTPDSGFSGVDTFLYTLVDGQGASNTATASFVIGTAPNDTFIATPTVEHFDGGLGSDTVDYSNSTGRVSVNLIQGVGWDGDASGDTYTSIENIIGSNTTANADFIYGNDENNNIWGLGGNDQIEGYGGADFIDGGAGSNYASYEHSDAAVQINLQTGVYTGGHAEGDTLIHIGKIKGSGYGDTIIGGEYDNTFYGNSGDDVLRGAGGHDTLHGGYQNDVLYGGTGADDLYGESGSDIFMFEAISAFDAVDNIHDFSVSEGDIIDISDLLESYEPLTDAINDFVQITDNGTHSTLSVDSDGGADNFVSITLLSNVTGLDETTLETSGNLVTV